MFSNRIILRSLHTSITNLLRRKGNPGLAYQLTLDNQKQIESDPEGFGNVESDLYEVHKTHKQHEKEIAAERDHVRHLMIKHKYFREQKLPNMLTYAEKEQIRLLHARDPDEWTVERLTESFPATIEVVQKILRAKWRARSVKRIREHDEAVMRNWELLRTDSVEIQHIPAAVKEHLQKFANRKNANVNSSYENWPTRLEMPKPKGNEFVSLITSCSKYADKEQNETAVPQLNAGKVTKQQNVNTIKQAAEEETYLLSQVQDKRLMRFAELKQKKLKDYELTPNDEHNLNLEKQAVELLQNTSGTGIIPHTQNKTTDVASQDFNYIEKFESKEIVISAEDRRRFEMSTIKERIHIPRKVWRRGATYKIEDCYYDDDGEFLYRVPGMTG